MVTTQRATVEDAIGNLRLSIQYALRQGVGAEQVRIVADEEDLEVDACGGQVNE